MLDLLERLPVARSVSLCVPGYVHGSCGAACCDARSSASRHAPGRRRSHAGHRWPGAVVRRYRGRLFAARATRRRIGRLAVAARRAVRSWGRWTAGTRGGHGRGLEPGAAGRWTRSRATSEGGAFKPPVTRIIARCASGCRNTACCRGGARRCRSSGLAVKSSPSATWLTAGRSQPLRASRPGASSARPAHLDRGRGPRGRAAT